MSSVEDVVVFHSGTAIGPSPSETWFIEARKSGHSVERLAWALLRGIAVAQVGDKYYALQMKPAGGGYQVSAQPLDENNVVPTSIVVQVGSGRTDDQHVEAWLLEARAARLQFETCGVPQGAQYHAGVCGYLRRGHETYEVVEKLYKVSVRRC